MSNTHKIVALVSLACFVLPLAVVAKRFPAPVVPPIVHKGICYTVPNDNGTKAYVVACDTATGKQLWKQTVFRKCICPLIEHDVQWVFIQHMRLEGERLILVNERDTTYSLDLKTRRVNHVKPRTPARSQPKQSLQ